MPFWVSESTQRKNERVLLNGIISISISNNIICALYIYWHKCSKALYTGINSMLKIWKLPADHKVKIAHHGYTCWTLQNYFYLQLSLITSAEEVSCGWQLKFLFKWRYWKRSFSPRTIVTFFRYLTIDNLQIVFEIIFASNNNLISNTLLDLNWIKFKNKLFLFYCYFDITGEI